ncbi:hypothetical protein GPJ56_003803 [Histomonas meleagridis]|uniref:uncharacterized protein n=1 Tax=Histomonas meleagridis TaxID=135588 RepID=UPI00355A4796|nr:hypothetical protein GPJ56_003803 [Histomonas meleagridis]KAH0805261.1 hypothetical protein GO595_002206 [Histomonas meleagridis]
MGIIFLLYGFDIRLLRKTHGAAFAGLIGSFILTITADNGIISDPCLVFLRVSLSLSPITSASAGFLTVILRLFLVISSFISVKFNYGEEKKLLKKSNNSIVETVYYITKSVTSKRAGTALVCLLVSFVFLSQDAFIRPTPQICDWQSILCPAVYIFFFYFEIYNFQSAL